MKDYSKKELFYPEIFLLLSMVQDYRNALEKIYDDYHLCTSQNLLATEAVELSFKIIILCDWLDEKEDDLISNESAITYLRAEFGHSFEKMFRNIKKRYSDFPVREIKKSGRKGITNYYIFLDQEENSLSFHETEAVRYMALANKKNIAITPITRTHLILIDSILIFIERRLDKTKFVIF